MHYEEITPDAALAPYIQCIWILEGCGTHSEEEYIFPDGRMELIFNYGAPFRRIISDTQQHLQSRSAVIGQISAAIRLKATGDIGVIGVRFHPWGMYSFFGEETGYLGEQDLSLDTFWKAGARELEERIANASRYESVVLIQDFLKRVKRKDHDRASHLKQIIQAISGAHGNISINALADQSNLSVRQFNRVFSNTVGLSPKKFAGIMRFQSFMKAVQQHPDSALGTLALASGYYDQSHFIREFRQYTGLSPKAYFGNHPGLSSLFISG